MKRQHIGVFIEQRGGVLHDVGLELLGKARELIEVSKGTVSAFVLGRDISAHSEDLIARGAGVVATIRCPLHRPQMATVMPGVMKKLVPTKRSGECIHLDVREDFQGSGPNVLEVHIEEPEEMPLEKADVVVAGGWGIDNPDGWTILQDLAALLCGAVGATRPPVDEGWAPESRMIGQSGKTVKPCLYMGIGISGMSHHVVGMDESEYIVAINTNPNAAIFEISDVAVVGDYREILPPLLKEIRARLPEGRTDTCELP